MIKFLRISFLLLAISAIVGLYIHGSIPQWASYHDFADKRSFCGLPNIMDTMSNIAFLIAGIYLMWKFNVVKKQHIIEFRDKFFYVAMSLSLMALFMGSYYYHWHPDNQRLIWDRLPIASFFSLLFMQILFQLKILKDKKLNLMMAISYWLFSCLSVFIWSYTGDLRTYAFAQFYPLACVLLMGVSCLMTPEYRKYTQSFFILIVGYGLAKIFESHDYEFLIYTHGKISGHTTKHLVAGLTMLFYFKEIFGKKLFTNLPQNLK